MELVVDEQRVVAANELDHVQDKRSDGPFSGGMGRFQEVHKAENLIFFVNAEQDSELVLIAGLLDCPPLVVQVPFGRIVEVAD